jgi:glycosyltransferase 2 family protein
VKRRILFTSAAPLAYYSRIPVTREIRNRMSYQISKKRIRRGLQIFTLVSLGSVVVIFLLTHSHMTVEALGRIKPLWLLCAIPFILIDWLGGGYRLYIFCRVFHPRIRFKTCVKANLANYFLGSITPSQTGGGPAQIYMLYVGGMPAVEATSASLMTFFSTTFFLILAGAGMFLFRRSLPFSQGYLLHLFNIGMIFFLLVAVFMVVALAFPGFFRELSRIIVRVASHLRKKDYLSVGSRAHGAIDAIDRCHRQLIHYARRHFHILIAGILVSAACFISKFAVAYVIVRSLGMQATFLDVALLQMVIILINYFFPTPGASGAAELSSAALMSSIVSKGLIGFYVILWRLLGTYVSVAVGGGVVLHELGKRDKVDVDDTIAEDVPEPEPAAAK